MGLLGDSWEDPRTAAILNLAGGLLSQRNLGAGLVQGMQGYTSAMMAAKKAQQEEEERKAIMAHRALQLRELEGRMAEAQRAREEAAAAKQARGSFLDSIDPNAGPALPFSVPQAMLAGLSQQEIQALEARQKAEAAEAFRRSIPSPQAQALGSLGADASPTAANAARMQPVDPRQQLMFDAMKAGQISPMDYLNSTAKDTTPIKLGANERLLDPRNNRVLVDAMPDPAKMSSVAQLMTEMNALPPGDPRRAIYQNAITKATTHQPATTVTVQPDNLGLKPKDRFEMEQKLGGDYTNATKTDRGIVSVSADLTNILKQPGAIKDQAAIYKFAKFLDPEGAVREADYAAIVKTAGGLDYVKNLVNRALTGEQLGPKQRTEMDNLVRSMAAVAQKRIDVAKKRFGGTAKMYNLDPENIFQTGDDMPLSLQDAAAAELRRRQGGQ